MSPTATTRREFLSFLGQGMLLAGVGTPVARELGLVGSPEVWGDEPPRLNFGPLEPLAGLLAETPPERLLSAVVPLIRSGTPLRELVAACALSNARACGGEDYVGFHTFMALAPALQMAHELPSERRPLPVLKVLYRNSRCLHDDSRIGLGDALAPVTVNASSVVSADALRDAVRSRDLPQGERLFAQLSRGTPEDAWNAVLPTVHDGLDVHRIVLAQRAWDMLSLVGKEYAGPLLRQSVHYCWKNEEHSARRFAALRDLLPRLFDEHHLDAKTPGTRGVDEAWLNENCQSLMHLSPAEAAGLAAAHLAEGISPNAICDAISLAANQLVLRDEGRPREWAQANKPVGSVHGDSIGVHASDAANAWRYIAQSASPRNCFASVILSAYHLAMDYHETGRNFREWAPRPTAEVLRNVTTENPSQLLTELDGSIRENDQERVCALVQKYCDLGHRHRGVLDLLLNYAVSEDGALHAEKYYRTTTDELARARPAFQTRQLIGLARVTASEYGIAAPGYEEACGLLNLPARNS